MLHYQLEKKQILDSIKFQVNQNLELSKIIQITIERVVNLLHLDRLVIYQLDIQPYASKQKHHSKCRKNEITYEAKSPLIVDSILNFKAENYSRTDKCWAKYRQGFTLTIDDVEQANFSDCLLALMHQLNVKSEVVAPIHLQDKLWGLLIAHQCSDVRIWHHHETQFIQEIAKCIEIAIKESQVYEKAQKQKVELEKRVKNQEQQIKDALVAAKIASQSKHEFIGTISHELKTPLTKVIGLSGTLLHWNSENGRSALPVEKQQKYLKTIQESGQHLLKLINNILEFSDLQSGKNLLNLEQISVIELCQEVTQSLAEKADILDIDLSLDFQIELKDDIFCGDRERMREILINLLDNGLKFTPPKGKVTLRVVRENKQLLFEIEDTGIGISEKQLPLLFESFTPLENFRQRLHEGAGIGLALTKHLVELHGGNIEVESALKQGSIFRVSLPILAEVNLRCNSQSSTHSLVELPKKNIILVTKDEQLATSVCDNLMAANYQVIWSVDTITAIEQIDGLESQTVILDQDNLSREIFDLIDTIGAIEKFQETKIILLHSAMDSCPEEYFLKDNIRDRFHKSSDISQLVNKVRGVTEQKPS